MIDTSVDFRTDAAGRDPDIFSPTMRRYHRLLWSKPLPNGALFDLKDTTPGIYLHHKSQLGEFALSSDTVIPTWERRASLQHIIGKLSVREMEKFSAARYTIGGMLIFPSNRVGGRITINGDRGFNRRIADRLDLTLECIRRHYRGEASPLGATLERYLDFFDLFGGFHGYVEFFHLQDLVTDTGQIQFFMPFNDFTDPALPTDVDSYRGYRRHSVDFIRMRNRRVKRWAQGAGLRSTLSPIPSGSHLATHGRPNLSTH